MNAYFKVYLDWLSAIEELSDDETGRLFRALLWYANTGEKVELQGNEKFIFPILINSINNGQLVYQRLCERNRQNGEKGGRPKKEDNPVGLTETEKTQWVNEKPTETQKSQDKIRKDKIRKDKINKGENSTRFSPPTVEQIEEYCKERKNQVDAQRFFDFYSSKGWMVGKNKMKDWKACVRTWERSTPKQERKTSYDLTELDRLGLEIPEVV